MVHKPDGTVVWEPSPESSPADGHGRFSIGDAIVKGITAMVLMSGAVGLMTVSTHTEAALNSPSPYCMTVKELTSVVAGTVTAWIAGTAAGVVLGPLVAARTVAGVLLRPALVTAAVVGAAGQLRKWRSGVSGLIRKLLSGEQSKIIEALRAIIAAAAKNPKFAREFNRLAGIEVLLQRLAAALPDCAWLHLVAQALAELLKDQGCKETLVAAGGVPQLVVLLQHPNPVVSGQGLQALARLADHALAQEAIREAGGLTRLVQLTADAVAATAPPTTAAVGLAAAVAAGPSGAVPAAVVRPASPGAFDRRGTLLPAVQLLQALSLDPASKAAIGEAGGVSVLLDVVSSSAPRSAAQSEAVTALHNLLRGCPDNQRALAALPAASEVLRGALAGYGPCWHPAKGDLHALLNVLARLQGVQEAGGFVVVQSQAAAAAPGAAVPAGGAAAAVPAAEGAPARA